MRLSVPHERQKIADSSSKLLKTNPNHLCLHFKQLGQSKIADIRYLILFCLTFDGNLDGFFFNLLYLKSLLYSNCNRLQ